MSALGDEIKAMIASDGPITLERYMELALGHPEHGYYMGRDPFGAAGDFITAPEISQMFGELLGLWAAEVWASMGRPRPLRLIELGPGRGTMMSDALRAARIVPDFRSAIDVTLIETSSTLAEIQHETLLTSGARVGWIPSLAEAPQGPAIVLANEFLDALPARQYVRSGGRWRERIVRLDKSGELEFAVTRESEPFILASGEEGNILEVNPAAHRLVFELAGRLVKQGGVALFVDYGHAFTGLGDTLQAVRAHRMVDPLVDPGEADLTAHVDFDALGQALAAAGANVAALEQQGRFLTDNGAEVRLGVLLRGKDETAALALKAGVRRLIDPMEMGRLFKVLAATSPERSAP